MSFTTELPIIVESNCSFIDNVTDGENNNCTEEIYIPYTARIETYVLPVLFAVIFIVGVVGNGILVLTICRHSNMRNVPNTYVLSLAIGDLLVIITSVPFTGTVFVLDTWPYGLIMCKISECAKDVSVGVSVFTLTALSADRFFAIVDPMRKLHATGGSRRATRFTKCMATMIWILAVLCAVPASFSYIRHFKVNRYVSIQVCYPFPEEFGPIYAKTVVICRFCILYVIPLSIIAVFYLLMARHLLQSTRNIPGEMQGQQRQIKARKKVAKMVMAFVVIFAICFFPQHIFMLWFYTYPSAADKYNAFWNYFRMLGFCLAYMNSCINPIALYCVSGTFRKYFNRYLCCDSGRQLLLTSGDHRRAQSFSYTTSKRQTSSRKGQHSLIPLATWQTNNSNDTQIRSNVPQEQETTITFFQNGIEQRI